MTITICDRCNKACDDKTANVHMAFYKNGNIVTRKLDLCGKCYTKYIETGNKVDKHRLTLFTDFMNEYE